MGITAKDYFEAAIGAIGIMTLVLLFVSGSLVYIGDYETLNFIVFIYGVAFSIFLIVPLFIYIIIKIKNKLRRVKMFKNSRIRKRIKKQEKQYDYFRDVDAVDKHERMQIAREINENFDNLHFTTTGSSMVKEKATKVDRGNQLVFDKGYIYISNEKDIDYTESLPYSVSGPYISRTPRHLYPGIPVFDVSTIYECDVDTYTLLDILQVVRTLAISEWAA